MKVYSSVSIRQVWIPHEQKEVFHIADEWDPVGDEWDPSDPPLSEEGQGSSIELCEKLSKRFGPPPVIFVSPKRRARETAFRAMLEHCIHCIGGSTTQLIYLQCLAQPDNKEEDGTIYGPVSNKEDWHRWFVQSRWNILEFCQSKSVQHLETRINPVWVFTHRPIIAVAYAQAMDCGVDPLNPSFKPWVEFEDDGVKWRVNK